MVKAINTAGSSIYTPGAFRRYVSAAHAYNVLVDAINAGLATSKSRSK